MRFRVVLPLIAIGVGSLIGAGCSSTDITNQIPTDSSTIVTQVTVAPTTLTILAGDTSRLVATAKNKDGAAVASATVTWTSSAASVATVNGGLVTALAVGATTITATSNGQSATATVTVTTSSANSFSELAAATSASAEEKSDVAASDGTNVLLALQSKTGNNPSQVGWVLMSKTGTVIAGPTYLNGPVGDPPRVGYGGGQYLLTWNDFSTSTSTVRGQFITTAGVASGSTFQIASHVGGFEDNNAVAYGAGTFLVNYRGPSGSGDGEFARTVSATGALGTELTLESGATSIQIGHTNSAFDGSNFLVGWADQSHVHAQLISPAGVAGTAVTVATATGNFAEVVSVAFNGTNYLVAFNEAFTAGGSNPIEGAYAQVVSPSASLVGSKVTIAAAANVVGIVASVVGAGSNFLAAFIDSAATTTSPLLPFKAKARFVSSTGTLVGNPITVATVSSGGKYPIAYLTGGSGNDYFGVSSRATPPATNPSLDFESFTGWDVYLLTAHILTP